MSLWLPTPEPKLHKLNDFIKYASDGRVSPVNAPLRKPVNEASDNTLKYYKRKASQAKTLIMECIAPGQSHELEKALSSETEDHMTTDLQTTLCHIYQEAETWHTKRQILSIFVHKFTKTELMRLIPGLTKWRIDEARKHASLVGPGKVIEIKPITRTRLDMNKVDHFIEFSSSPYFLQDVAFGTKTLKLSTGEKMEIPGAVRTLIASRLIATYESYCQEIGYEPLGRSTLFTILQVNDQRYYS